MNELNPTGLKGIEFVEFSSKNPQQLEKLFCAFGFSKKLISLDGAQNYFNQNDIHFIINNKTNGHAAKFTCAHGPSISAMAFRVENAKHAYEVAISRGAKEAVGEYFIAGKPVPAIYGIGDSLIYFVDSYTNDNFYLSLGFVKDPDANMVRDKGFTLIDHLTNNVYKGEMEKWANFYKQIFGFSEVRYFDIKGAKTGLVSYALQSPCKTFCIPINEGTDKKSQINEYLEEYNGPGIQHLAFLTEDIIASLDALAGSEIETLEIDDDYYKEVFKRVPGVSEDHQKLQDHQILIDGDEDGYLLQIFTKTIIGPIFIEIIQRKNHYSFGEGNFGALFRSIEKDQERRGYI